MEMSDQEIVRRFKESKNKQQQINILAELNSCDPGEIRALLKLNNIDLRGGNHGRAAIVNKDFEDAVNEMIEKDKEKAKKRQRLKRRILFRVRSDMRRQKRKLKKASRRFWWMLQSSESNISAKRSRILSKRDQS